MYNIGTNKFLVTDEFLIRHGDDLYMPNFPGHWIGMRVFVTGVDRSYIVVDPNGKLEEIVDDGVEDE